MMERRRREVDDSRGVRVAHRYDATDDVALVELARRDAGAGWTAIWDAHGHALHGYCRRLLDDSADADDVVADVFLVASRRIDQLRDPSALRAWLFAIARRSVQRRWRARQRTVPVDPQGAVVSARTSDETADDLAGVVAGDAAELVEAASVGLSVADRELLALTLGADLDTSEVARITGKEQSSVSVRVTRLKDRVAKAAGALLVARHHRRDCEILDGILASWDGTFDTVWRKRIARHVESCATCEEHRRGAVTVFASPLLLAPPSDALRDRVLEPIRSVRPRSGDASAIHADRDGADDWTARDDGFPVAEAWPSATRRRGVAILAVAAALLLIVIGGVVLSGSDGDDVDLAAAEALASTTTTTAEPTTTSTTVPETTTSAPPIVTPTDPPAGGLPDPGPTIAPPPPTQAVPPTAPPAPPPGVRLEVEPASFSSCGSSSYEATATIVVTAGGGAESTTIRWDGGSPGETVVDGVGTKEVVVGPLSRVDGGPVSQVITIVATTVDATGASASDTDTVTIDVVPC